MGCRSLVVVLLAAAVVAAAEPETVTVEQCETAGIAGFRAMWDQPVVLAAGGVTTVKDKRGEAAGATAVWHPAKTDGVAGAIAFDAIHRSLLVRFPAAAERLAKQIDRGYRLAKLELVLPYKHTEFEPPGSVSGIDPLGGYSYRLNWGVGGLWAKRPPRWHAVAWALRKPWHADKDTGPTYNAYIHGAGYWGRYGAADGDRDRVPERFGPTEVSTENVTGRMDVTAAATDEAFGKTLAARLRRLADCGFLVRKWETYDHRYYTGCYEWATATGGRGIVIDAPKLVATFVPDAAAEKVGKLAPPADVAALAAELKRTGKGGAPTAVMPSDEEIAAFAERFAPRRPAWMPRWQWRRIEELLAVGDARGGLDADTPFWYRYVAKYLRDRMARRGRRPGPQRVYAGWVDVVLARQFRGWHGFEAAKVLLPWHLYREAMPEPMKDHWRNYWTAWLMPDRRTSLDLFPDDPTTPRLIHPMYDQLKKGRNTSAKVKMDSYYAATGDWRGNKSFFRGGFCYTMSTMNFNHTASMGALLGGDIIGSKRALADGRHGVEHWPLRTWSWLDGSTQESIDHYYFAITLSAQKMIADFGPTHFDRMMGRTILAKSVDELAGAYHPNLRRFLAGSARTATEHLLATREGVYHIVHTLSKRGVLHGLPPAADGADEADELPGGMPVVGREVPPLRVAGQSLRGPWGPAWMWRVVDDKPLPFQMTTAFTQWGGHRKHPIQRRTFLGRDYGLFSCDAGWGFVHLLGHWRRKAQPVTHMRQRGTMLLRYGVNETQLVNMAPGWIRHFGSEATVHHRNKMVVVTSPYPGTAGRKDLKSLQATVALFNYERPKPSWRITAGGKAVEKLPHRARAGEPIVIHDGVACIGLIPLPATDLGRDAEVILRPGVTQTFHKIDFTPALLVDNYNLRATPLTGKPAFDKAFAARADRAAGGFVVEFGDESEYGSAEAFAEHMAAAKLDVRDEPDANLYHVDYRSGEDRFEVGIRTTYREGRPTDGLFAYRRVNGASPCLPKGVWRRTPLAVQASTGRLEVGGAKLTVEAGHMAYLRALPEAGIYAACNPFPEPTDWRLELPGGVTLAGEGKLAMARVAFHAEANRLAIDYALRPGQEAEKGIARALIVGGLEAAPQVVLNGRAIRDRIEKADGNAFRVPLLPQEPPSADDSP